jgi:hypothetical protein
MITQNTMFAEKNNQEPLLSLKNILNENKIRLMDTDDETGLNLFCYTHCTDSDNDLVKQCRGVVFHGENLVLQAFSYTPEYTDVNIDEIKNYLSTFEDWNFYESIEGCILRLFYFSGKWFLTTHKKLNAFRSKWSSKHSFGTLFQRALEHEQKITPKFSNRLQQGENILQSFQNSLSRDKQYIFLLRNNEENRIVAISPDSHEHSVYHVGTIVNGNLSMSEDTGLSYPPKIQFNNLDNMIDYIKNNINPKKSQGIVCFHKHKNFQIKIVHLNYSIMSKVRGNEPSLKFRYLQVRMNRKMTSVLYSLYPEMTSTFDDYENTIYDIARNIHRAYIQRFIKKQFVTVPREEYQVINQCHQFYLGDRINNRITLEQVIKVLNKQSPTDLNHMIRRFKMEKEKRTDSIPRNYSSRNNSATSSPNFVPLKEEQTIIRLQNF